MIQKPVLRIKRDVYGRAIWTCQSDDSLGYRVLGLLRNLSVEEAALKAFKLVNGIDD